MKTSNKILLGFFLAIFVVGISIMSYLKANTAEIKPIGSTGDVNTKSFHLSHLHTLEVSTGKVYLLKGAPKVEITCGDNVRQLLDTGFDNGKFYIRKKDNIPNKLEFEVQVYADSLENIKLSNQVEMLTEELYSVDMLTLETSSSARANLNLKANNLVIKVQNGSNVQLSGTTDTLKAVATNGSYLDGKEMTALIGDLKVNSGGNIRANVIEKLSVTISSGGHITYAGTPEMIQNSISSGGSLTRLDEPQ